MDLYLLPIFSSPSTNCKKELTQTSGFTLIWHPLQRSSQIQYCCIYSDNYNSQRYRYIVKLKINHSYSLSIFLITKYQIFYIIKKFLKMINTGSFIIICLFVSFSSCSFIKSNCLFQSQNKIFVLLHLKASQPYQINQNNQSILFNFCQPFTNINCKTQQKHLAYLINQDNKSCQPLTSSRSGQFSTFYQNQDESQPNKLSIVYEQDHQGTHQGHRTLHLEIVCGQKQFDIINWRIDDYLVYIKTQSIHGCPIYESPSLLQIIDDYEIVVFAFSFIAGLLFIFYGRIMVSVVSFLSMGITMTILLSLLCFKLMEKNVHDIYLYLSILTIIGGSFGISFYISRHYIKIPLFFIGALFGFFILSSLKIIIVILAFNATVVTFMRYFVIIGMNVFGYLTIRYKDYAIIITSSFTGSYLVIRGISLILGGFPSQFEIVQLVQSKMITSIPITFFIYLSLIQILAGIGAIYQQLKMLKEQFGEGYESEMSERTSFLSNAISVTLEPKLDIIHNHIQTLINRYNNRQSQIFKEIKGPEGQARELEPYTKMFQKDESNNKI